MSEQINKVLASTSQAFSTAEQKQARDNISAQAKISYSYSGSTITAIDGSAVGNPASLTGVDHDSNLSGNGGTIPLGLSTSITIARNRESATLAYDHLTLSNSDNDPILSSTISNIYMSGHAGNASSPYTANYGLQGMSIYGTDSYHNITATATLRYSGATFKEGDDSAKIKATGLTLHTTADGDQLVDASSVVRWNSYSSMSAGSWSESSNPLSTGFGGNQVSSASQYNVGAGNWAVRTVKASGIPDMDLYGFRNLPVGQGPFGVNGNGAWIDLKPETRWESSFQATSNTYNLLNIPKNATAFINVQGRFDSCSYVNMTTSKDAWLSVTDGGTTAGGGFRTWPLTNITTVAKGGTADEGYTPQLQVVTTGNTTVGFTVNMVIKEA